MNHVVKDPWGHDYVYVNNGENEYPTLYSKGPDGKAGTTDDVLPDRALYDAPFKDTSWTKGWMPYYLRGYVLAPDKRTKGAIEEEVKAVLAAEQGPAEGEFVLHDGWEFSRDQKEWKSVRVPHDWAISGPFDINLDGHTGKLPWKGCCFGCLEKHISHKKRMKIMPFVATCMDLEIAIVSEVSQRKTTIV